MIFYRITDYLVVMSILDDQGIKKMIYEDGTDILIPDVIKDIWIGAVTDEKLVGCYHLQKRTTVMWEIHARILPQYRKKYGWDASRGVLRWIIENVPQVEKIICFVPDPFKDVALHCAHVGFQRAGYIPESYKRKSKLVGLKMFAISADDIRRGKCQQPQ